jgi:ClpP class serine protease
MKKISFQNILEEVHQGHEIRKKIYSSLEKEFNKPVISFFTSFIFPVAIIDKDVDMIECVLQGTDTSKGFVLVINSPGGSGLAAERIIQICRSYSNSKFDVVVPKMAKSAATMICLGANKNIYE